MPSRRRVTNPAGVQLLQVLAQVALRQASDLHQLGHRALPVLERVQHGETRRFSERTEPTPPPVDRSSGVATRVARTARFVRSRPLHLGRQQLHDDDEEGADDPVPRTMAGICSALCTVMRP
jgi:hypothetical protein